MNNEARTISAIKEISTILAQPPDERHRSIHKLFAPNLDRAKNWNKFGWRYFNPIQVSYTVDLEKLDAFLEGKRLTKSK